MEGLNRSIVLIVILMILYPTIQYAQERSRIALPVANTIEKTTWFTKDNKNDIVVYITENHELFINDKRIQFWNAIVPKVMDRDTRNGDLLIFSSRIIFHIDYRSQYAFVDRVKEELSRTQKKFFVYRLEGGKEPIYIGSKLYGTIKDEWLLERINERNQKKDSFFLNKIRLPGWHENRMEASDMRLRNNFSKALYQGNMEYIQEVLGKYTMEHITLLSENKFVYRDKTYEINDEKMLVDLFNTRDVILVRFDKDLDYGSYIKFLEAQKNLVSSENYKREKSGIFIEVSYGLEKKIKEWGLQIF